METMKLVLPLNEEMTAIRRHIHQHPELSNEEFETTKLIREKRLTTASTAKKNGFLKLVEARLQEDFPERRKLVFRCVRCVRCLAVV